MAKHAAVVLLMLVGSVVAYDADKFKDRLTEFRIRSQNLHVDALERQVEQLEHEFDQLSEPISQAGVDKIKARLVNLEGNPCSETEVSCGGQIPECVSHLFFCDGKKDCKNGYDEGEELCSMEIIRPGSTFKGSMYMYRLFWPIVISVVEVDRLDFGPVAWVHVRLITKTPEDDYKMFNYPVKGYFSFGFRTMDLVNQLPHFDHCSNVCTFYLRDSDHVDCVFETLTYKAEVAAFRLMRT